MIATIHTTRGDITATPPDKGARAVHVGVNHDAVARAYWQAVPACPFDRLVGDLWQRDVTAWRLVETCLVMSGHRQVYRHRATGTVALDCPLIRAEVQGTLVPDAASSQGGRNA